MKVAVPVTTADGLEAVRSAHFGHSEYFTICTIEDGKVTDVDVVKNVDHDTVGCGGVIDFALSQGIDAIIAAGMGVPPFTRFTQGGVAVYLDNTCPKCADVIARFISGQCNLMTMDQACAHH